MAEVWAAHMEGPGGFVKSVALKFTLDTFAGDPELERLFVNEARLAAQLQHANLVGVFDFDKLPDSDPDNPGRYYIAMERVDGHDLRRTIQVAARHGQRLAPALALFVAGEVLRGLRYVHERTDTLGRPLGLIHRDVSPHNVLVGMGGEVKLSDFGIAKAMSQSLGTQSGMIRGKLAYASPEQLRGEAIDHRTDQFGLGVTLWEMMSGRRLFEGNDEAAIVGRVLACQIPDFDDAVGADAGTAAVVRRMLAPQPGARFASTGDALAAVQALPQYLGDSTFLADLMRRFFAPAPVLMPPTMPIPLPGNMPTPPPVPSSIEPPSAGPAPSEAGPAGDAGAGVPRPRTDTGILRTPIPIAESVESSGSRPDDDGRGASASPAALARTGPLPQPPAAAHPVGFPGLAPPGATQVAPAPGRVNPNAETKLLEDAPSSRRRTGHADLGLEPAETGSFGERDFTDDSSDLSGPTGRGRGRDRSRTAGARAVRDTTGSAYVASAGLASAEPRARWPLVALAGGVGLIALVVATHGVRPDLLPWHTRAAAPKIRARPFAGPGELAPGDTRARLGGDVPAPELVPAIQVAPAPTDEAGDVPEGAPSPGESDAGQRPGLRHKHHRDAKLARPGPPGTSGASAPAAARSPDTSPGATTPPAPKGPTFTPWPGGASPSPVLGTPTTPGADRSRDPRAPPNRSPILE